MHGPLGRRIGDFSTLPATHHEHSSANFPKLSRSWVGVWGTLEALGFTSLLEASGEVVVLIMKLSTYRYDAVGESNVDPTIKPEVRAIPHYMKGYSVRQTSSTRVEDFTSTEGILVDLTVLPFVFEIRSHLKQDCLRSVRSDLLMWNAPAPLPSPKRYQQSLSSGNPIDTNAWRINTLFRE